MATAEKIAIRQAQALENIDARFEDILRALGKLEAQVSALQEQIKAQGDKVAPTRRAAK